MTWIESALQENSPYSWKGNCSVNSSVCASWSAAGLSWAGVTIYCPQRPVGIVVGVLGQESELCQEVFFGDMNGSINAVNWRDCADAFLSDKRRLCPPPELVILLMFLSHWDSGEQGSVFFPPWHHKQHGCPYWCVLTALGDTLFRPMVTVNISPQRKHKNHRSCKIFHWHWFDSNSASTYSGLTKFPVFRTESLSHSEFACPRFWLLLGHPSESTILRMEKDSNGFFFLN